jgi:DNA-binding transcriptional LysR family regulator
VALVPTALERSGMAGVLFRPLAEPTPLYDTHCLWKTDRDQGALGAFLEVVRQVAAGGGTLDT